MTTTQQPSIGAQGEIKFVDQLVVKTSRDETTDEMINELRICTLENETAKRYIVRAYQFTLLTKPMLVFERGISDALKMIPTNPEKRYKMGLDLMHDVCHALKLLKSMNICHRDVKHDNVIIFEQNGHYIYKLADFGLSGYQTTNRDVRKMGTYVNPRMMWSYAHREPYAMMYDTWVNDLYALCVSFYLNTIFTNSSETIRPALGPKGRLGRLNAPYAVFVLPEFQILSDLAAMLRGNVYKLKSLNVIALVYDVMVAIINTGQCGDVYDKLIETIASEQTPPPKTYTDHTPTIEMLTKALR